MKNECIQLIKLHFLHLQSLMEKLQLEIKRKERLNQEKIFQRQISRYIEIENILIDALNSSCNFKKLVMINGMKFSMNCNGYPELIIDTCGIMKCRCKD